MEAQEISNVLSGELSGIIVGYADEDTKHQDRYSEIELNYAGRYFCGLLNL